MNRRSAGILLLTAGGLLVVAGVVGMVNSGGGTGQETAASTTTNAPAPTTSGTEPLPTTTTTTIDVVSAIEAFVPTFADAIAGGDVDLLYQTLHPAVTDLFDEELCRAFIEAEILLLEDYRLTGDVTGPETQDFGEQAVEIYTGSVAFGFQGQDFEADATFAYEQGVRWFTECR